jgi:hypothetical protein
LAASKQKSRPRRRDAYRQAGNANSHLRKAVNVARHYMAFRNLILSIFVAPLALINSYCQDKQDKGLTLAKIKAVFKQINDYKNFVSRFVPPFRSTRQ